MSLSTNFIEQMYVAYFGRPADPAGLAYYASLDEGALEQAFSASPESRALYGGATGSAIVNAVYRNLFNRDAEPAGSAAWTALMDSGQLSPAGIALAILQGAANDDRTAVGNKVAAAVRFTAHVDTAAENTGYAGATAAAIARDYLKAVGSTQASLDTALAQVDQAVFVATGGVLNPGGPTGSTGPQAFVLTAGHDTFTGAGSDDTITGSAPGLFANGDSIDGGGGNDTLTVTGETATLDGSGITVQNVETASLTTTSTVNLATTGWAGLTSLTVTGAGAMAVSAPTGATLAVTDTAQANGSVVLDGGSSLSFTAMGATGGTIQIGASAAPTGDVSVSITSTGAATMGSISVRGGSTVTISQATANAVATTATLGAVTVTGTAATTVVTVNNQAAATADVGMAGVTRNAVTINDVNAASTALAGKITDVTVHNYTTLTIGDSALANLTVSGGTGDIAIHNGTLAAPTTTTLIVSLDGITGGTLADQNVYTTVNATLLSSSTLAGISDTALTALTVAGTGVLTLTSAAGATGLHTVTVTGTAGVVANLSAVALTAADTTGSTGTSTLTINAGAATFAGGAGVDKITLGTTTVSKNITLGDGSDSLTLASGTTAITAASISGGDGAGTDTLVMVLGDAAGLTTAGLTAGVVAGFEELRLTGTASTALAIDLAKFGNPGTVQLHGGTSNTVTLSNLVSDNTLVLDGAGKSYTLAGAFTGGSDTLNLQLAGNATGTGLAYTASGNLAATGVENLNITTVDSQPAPSGLFNDTFTTLGNGFKTFTIGGNAGLFLTSLSNALTSVDASGITLGDFSWTTGALSGPSTIKGSLNGTNTLDFSVAQAGAAVTYTGGEGNDSIICTASEANNITLGNGTNSYTGSTNGGNNTVTGGTGNDTVSLGSGNNNIGLGNGNNTVTVTTGSNTITTGAGNDTINIGATSAGANTIDVGGGADRVNLTGIQTTSANLAVITGIHAGDILDLHLTKGTATNLSAQTDLGISQGDFSVASLASALTVAALGNSAHTTTVFNWFTFNGNTYIVHDTSNTPDFVNTADTVVELIGTFDLSSATVAAGVITF